MYALMPKAGQPWNRDFLEQSSLLQDFCELAGPLLEGSGWPTLDTYTWFVERERSTRAPELSPVCFAPPAPRPRRRRLDRALEPTDVYDGRVVLRGEVPCL